MNITMKIPQPKRWWFAVAVPVALLITFVSMVIVGLVKSPVHDFKEFSTAAAILAYFGGMAFPLGLFAPFVWSPDTFGSYGGAMFVTGWTLYGLLTVAGFIKPLRVVFWILFVLLVVNIGGCHLSQIGGSFKGSF
jgi:hypothetical protein